MKTVTQIGSERRALAARQEEFKAELELARGQLARASEALASDPSGAGVYLATSGKVDALERALSDLDARLAALARELDAARLAERRTEQLERLRELAVTASDARADYERALVEANAVLDPLVSRMVEAFNRWGAVRAEFVALANEASNHALSRLSRTYDDNRYSAMRQALDALLVDLADVDLTAALAVGLWHSAPLEVSYPYTPPALSMARALQAALEDARGMTYTNTVLGMHTGD